MAIIKLLPLILENVDQEEDLGKPTIVGERGYQFLKGKIDALNKKASKWGVPPMELKILKEEFKQKYKYSGGESGNDVISDNPPGAGREFQKITVKQYEIQIIGNPPRVEGFEFIAKIEHTPEGNILNYAPKASSKNLPSEYRTAVQKCDVCNQARERNNTFILKLEKEDTQRFPNKKSGDYVMVGSRCLKRFLPGISANSLIEYAEMIEALRNSVEQAEEMLDGDFGGGGGGRGNWADQHEMGYWLSAVYLHTGKYFSKKKAKELGATPTLQDAFTAMNSKTGSDHEDDVHKRLRIDEAFDNKVKSFNEEFLKWIPTKDFDSLMEQKPEYADFFNNLKVISKQEYFKINNAGFFSALFQMFLRDKGELEKKAALKKATSDFTYFGQPGGKIKVKIKVNKIKEYESQWGQGLIVNMEGEGIEKDVATGQDITKKGNLLYFTNNFELEEGEEAEIEATVKSHQPNKYTQIPETVITRAKIINFITHPEKNAGKTKIKDLSGIVEIAVVSTWEGWSNEKNTRINHYNLTFNYSHQHHPGMPLFYFTYKIPDEATYQKFKPFENKLVEAKWTLERVMTADKLKHSSTVPVSKLSIINVLGDIPPKQPRL